MKKPRWVAHNQDRMPARLKPDTMVRVKLKNMYSTYLSRAGGMMWFDCGEGSIIGYQIEEETK